MGYATEVAADNPLNWWRCLEAPAPFIVNHGSLATPLVQAGATFFATTGPSSDSIAFFNGLPGQDWNTSGVALTLGRPGAIELWSWQPLLLPATTQLLSWNGLSAGSVDLFLTSAGLLEYVSAGGVALVSALPIPFGRWNHYVAVDDGVTSTLYLNGASVASGAGSGAGSGTFTVYLMGRAEAQTNICLWSEAASYGAALSAARVLAHFNAADLATVPPKPVTGAVTASLGPPVQFVGDLTAQILSSVRKVY